MNQATKAPAFNVDEQEYDMQRVVLLEETAVSHAEAGRLSAAVTAWQAATQLRHAHSPSDHAECIASVDQNARNYEMLAQALMELGRDYEAVQVWHCSAVMVQLIQIRRLTMRVL